MEALSRDGAARRAAARRFDPRLAVRALGAPAVLAVGAIHLHEYNKLYSAIPTIGTLFVLNFAGATAIGLGLLAPVERLFGGRLGAAAVGLLALGGIGLAATAFVFLTISEHTPLFGFMATTPRGSWPPASRRGQRSCSWAASSSPGSSAR